MGWVVSRVLKRLDGCAWLGEVETDRADGGKGAGVWDGGRPPVASSG